jgi:hypothetical protein
VDAVAVVKADPVETVTAVDVENVALVAVEVVDALPAVMETSAADWKNILMMQKFGLFAGPLGNVNEPVLPDAEYDLATSTLLGLLSN